MADARRLEHGLRTDRLQVLTAVALRLRRQQLAQAPDRRVECTARALGIELGPEQVGQTFAPVWPPRIGEQETRQTTAGRSELRPDPVVDVRDPENSQQSDTQHRGAPVLFASEA